jgi:hypothetical protein
MVQLSENENIITIKNEIYFNDYGRRICGGVEKNPSLQ